MKKRTILNLILLISLVAIPSASMAGVMGSILIDPVDPTITTHSCGIIADRSCNVYRNCTSNDSYIVPCSPPTILPDGTPWCYDAAHPTQTVDKCLGRDVSQGRYYCQTYPVNTNCQLITTHRCPCECVPDLAQSQIVPDIIDNVLNNNSDGGITGSPLLPPTMNPYTGFPQILPNAACPQGIATGQTCTISDLNGNSYNGTIRCQQ